MDFYEKRYKRMKQACKWLSILLAFFILFTSLLVYLHYDYIVFKALMTHQYIDTDTLDILYERHLRISPKGQYYRNFDHLMIALSTAAIRFENQDRYTFLYIPERYQEYRERTETRGMMTEAYAIDDTIAYLSLTNFSSFSYDMVKENLSMLQDYDHLIIDLRENRGGRIDIMRNIASLFLPKHAPIAIMETRFQSRTYRSQNDQKLVFDNIVILQTHATASASENLIAALDQNLSNVMLVGEPTFGKSIGQFTIPLTEGYAVKATTLVWYMPNGKAIDENGIEPHIYYSGEDMLAYAIDILNQSKRDE